MLTSFEVGAVFTIQNEASGVLSEMAEQFTRLEELARTLQGSLASIGEGAFAALESGFERINQAFSELDARVGQSAELIETGMGTAGLAVGEATAKVEALASAFERAATAAGRTKDASGVVGGGGPAGGGSPEHTIEEGALSTRDGWNEASRRDHASARAEDLNFNAQRDTERRLADYENHDFDAQRDTQRREADYENRDYDARERGRVRQTQADEPFEREAEAGAAGNAGGRAGRHGPIGGILQGMAPLVEGAGVYESEKSAMHEDLAIRNALIEGLHITPEQDPQKFEQSMQQMREIARQAASGTIFSEARSAEAMPVLARELGFTGDEGMQKFSQIYRPALQAAEVAQQTGLGGLDSSLSASVEYAHMTGAYEPKELEQHLNVLRSVAQLTNQSMHGEETILKYSVPIGMAGGMNPDDAAIQTGFLQQQGFNSSTAGTGLSAVILGALNSGGGISSHLEQSRHKMEHSFAAAVRLSPQEAKEAHGGRGSAHVQALAELGITHGGKLTTVNERGDFDIGKLQTDVRQYAAQHTHQEVLNTLHEAFGTRGERVAAIYAEKDSGTRQERFAEAVRSSPSANQIQTDLSHAPLQQFEQMLANLANIGNTLATTTLPGLNAAFERVNTGLIGFNNWLNQHQTAATVAGYSALGAGTLGAVGLAGLVGRNLWSGVQSVGSGIGSLLGSGAEAVEGGVGNIAARIGPRAGLAGLLTNPLTGVLAATSGLAGDTPSSPLLNTTTPEMKARQEQQMQDYLRTHPTAAAAAGAAGIHGTTPNGSLPGAAAAAPAASAPITIHVGPVSMNGVADETTFRTLLSKLNDALKGAMSHATGSGTGSDSSTYVFGGT